MLEKEAVKNRSSRALKIIDRTSTVNFFLKGNLYHVLITGMLLLLKKCSEKNLYNNKHTDYDKNIELLMTHKKACGNIIKVRIIFAITEI